MPRLSKDEKEIIDKTVEEIAEELEATQEEQAEIVATKEDFDKLESKAIEDLEQEYNEFCKKEKEVPIIVTNEDILNELKEIKGTTNGNWTQTLKLRGQVSDQNKDIDFIKIHHTKVTLLWLAVTFGAGYIFGTEHEYLKPYGSIIWDFVTSFIK